MTILENKDSADFIKGDLLASGNEWEESSQRDLLKLEAAADNVTGVWKTVVGWGDSVKCIESSVELFTAYIKK